AGRARQALGAGRPRAGAGLLSRGPRSRARRHPGAGCPPPPAPLGKRPPPRAGGEKRLARGAAACSLWEEAKRHAGFDPRPWEELAKFHEHRRRDFAAARAVVEDALGLAGAAGAPLQTVGAFTHRLGRLERRMTSAGGRSSEPRE